MSKFYTFLVWLSLFLSLSAFLVSSYTFVSVQKLTEHIDNSLEDFSSSVDDLTVNLRDFNAYLDDVRVIMESNKVTFNGFGRATFINNTGDSSKTSK
ncbi:hypothetical protein [Capybara microvirus Cap1_SP_83]|nr:hypothetical protein [Capybara microvirus Cap1_SP_83]